MCRCGVYINHPLHVCYHGEFVRTTCKENNIVQQNKNRTNQRIVAMDVAEEIWKMRKLKRNKGNNRKNDHKKCNNDVM